MSAQSWSATHSPRRIRRWQDYVESILIAVLFALIVRTFVLSGYRVPTSTMAPSLKPGDFIFSFRIPYGLRLPLTQKKFGGGVPERGEVVVFTFPDQPRVNYVKRVIGIPGDLIEIKQGRLSVNSQPFDYEAKSPEAIGDLPNFDELQVFAEKAPEGDRLIILKKQGPWKDFGPLVVPQGEVFLLGDNRDLSDDSRYWGTVPIARIDGRVFMIWLSVDWNRHWGETRWPTIRTDRTWSVIR